MRQDNADLTYIQIEFQIKEKFEIKFFGGK